MRPKLQVYTSLFDIGRDQVDGRRIESYLEWLARTIQLFPGIVVFHDGSCDALVSKTSQLVRVEKRDLGFYRFLPYVNQIFHEFTPQSPNDVTFKLPEYSLIQFSKFDLAQRVMQISEAESFLWVDAGISRFVDTNDSMLLQKNASKLIRNEYDFAFEINLRKNINFRNFKINSPKPGSCGRVISGTSFWIQASAISTLLHEINALLESWKSNSLWDNEQVALRTLYESPSHLNSSHFILQNLSKTGSVARKMGNSELIMNNHLDTLIRRRLLA